LNRGKSPLGDCTRKLPRFAPPRKGGTPTWAGGVPKWAVLSKEGATLTAVWHEPLYGCG